MGNRVLISFLYIYIPNFTRIIVKEVVFSPSAFLAYLSKIRRLSCEFIARYFYSTDVYVKIVYFCMLILYIVALLKMFIQFSHRVIAVSLVYRIISCKNNDSSFIY